jgi:hypothetical protein
MRLCLCCGAATETPSIPACWTHWQILPEDLRSSIVKTSARLQLTAYAQAATEAITIWREAGAWRPERRSLHSNAAAQAPGNIIPFRAISPGFIDRQVAALRALPRLQHRFEQEQGGVRWGT